MTLLRLAVIDIPNERSSHETSTPRGGGVAVMMGLTCAVVLGTTVPIALGVVAVSVLAATLGFVDDLKSLPAVRRLAIQFLLAILLAASLLNDVGSQWPGTLAVVGVAAAFVCAYTNAFNFMDGINGISSFNASLAGVWLYIIGHIHGLPDVEVLAAAIFGASLGFLPWNSPSARMFLGDVGSYGLGFAISGLMVLAVAQGATVITALAPAVIYAGDTAWTLLRRVRQRKSWREAHREHVYQRLCQMGYTHVEVAAATTAASASVCLVSLLPAPASETAMIGVVSCYLVSPHLAARLRDVN